MALSSNWLTTAINNLRCCKDSGHIPAPEMQYKSIYLGSLLRRLQELYPSEMEASNGPIGACVNWLPAILAKIECGEMIRDCTEFWETLARIQVAIADAEAALAGPEDAAYFTWKAGVYSWPDTATSNSISIVGLLSTDVVFAQVSVNDTTQYVVKAFNDHANDQIDVTLSDAGTTNVKISYQVLRPIA